MFDSRSECRSSSGGKKAIDLRTVAEDIGRHWLSILFLTVAVWICAFVFLSWRQQSSYASSATVAVSNARYTSNVDTYNMLNYASDVTLKLQQVLESREFRDAVAADLGYSGFKGSVSASAVGDSNLLRITVRSGQPEVSYLEVRSILNNYKKFENNLSGGTCFTVLEQPAIQERPDMSSGSMKKAAVAALVAMMLMCFALAGLSLCKDSVEDGIDVVNKTGARFLGAIYRNKRFKAEPDMLISDPESSMSYTEEIRRLAIRIDRKMAQKGQKVLLVTSAGTGEGKSAAAANIATALEQKGRKVVLIDEARSKELTRAELEEQLSARPAADRNAQPGADLNTRPADCVIIDAAPVSESSDAVELAGIADTSVLIIRRHDKDIPEIRKAVNALGGPENMLGCIVTDVRKYNSAVSVSECARIRDGDRQKYLVDRGDRNEVEIDFIPFLKDLAREARRSCILLAAVVLLFGGAFYYLGGRSNSANYTAYTTFTVEPARTVIYDIDNMKNLTTALVGKMVPSMLTSDAMKSIVKEDMGYARSESFPANITASVVTNTNLVRLSVSAADPQLAYDVMQTVLRKSSIVTDAAIGSVQLAIVDESGVPTKRGGSTGYGKKAAAAGVILGLLVCLAALVIKLILRDTVLSEDEISWKLKTTVYGRLPWIKTGKKPITIESDDIPNNFAESIREIRYRVEKESRESGMNTFLMTSAVKSEGKTTAAVNLALALAGRQHRVVLVDGDLRDPSVMKELGMEPAVAGLSDFLAGKADPGQILVPYGGNKNLTILPGGTADDGPYELWSRESAGAFLRELRDQYDYVIIDGPQSAVVSETALLADLAQACIFMIRRDCAKFAEVCEGVETFEESDCRFLGCVMRS